MTKRKNWWKVIHICPCCGQETAPVQIGDRDERGLNLWRPTPCRDCLVTADDMIEKTRTLEVALEYIRRGAYENFDDRGLWPGTTTAAMERAQELYLRWERHAPHAT